MGLVKFLEERKKERERQKQAETVYKRERVLAYEQGVRQGRVQGAYTKGVQEGKRKASKPSGFGGVMNTLGNLGYGINQVERNMFPEFRGMDPFGSGSPRKKHHKKKGKGKTIVVHVK